MSYTNSPLVNHTRLSPNHSGVRNHAIDTITIHCVVGQCSVEALGSLFADPSFGASSNYGIGYDGRIGMYVEEKNRSWCSSSSSNDNRAVTIEVASDTTEPLAVRDAAYKSLIKLVADICRRNGIKRLKWSTNRYERMNHLNGCNMTVHRDYANKSCPGTWLYERHGQIAAAVNKLLGTSTQSSATSASSSQKKNMVDEIAKEVIVGKWGAGDERKKKLTAAGYDYSAVQSRVNELLSGKGRKTVDDLAKEVIAGKWSAGNERKKKLTAAGYNYSAVQSRVNELLSGKGRKTIDDLAKEVIAGKWSAGEKRKRLLTQAGYDYSAVQKRVNELMK